jgi:hypothetical protein
MHADVFGNIFQHHRLNILNSIVQELFLTMDNRLDHLVDGLPAVLNIAQQINR